jgi:hypothetical protein
MLPSSLYRDYHPASISRLKKVNQGSGQVVDPELAVGGAGRSAVAQEAMADKRKSAAYTVVCEHFEPTRNAALGTQTHF